jgi:hypothetical protein
MKVEIRAIIGPRKNVFKEPKKFLRFKIGGFCSRFPKHGNNAFFSNF